LNTEFTRALKELNKIEVKKQYRAEISNRFASFENLDAEVDINRASETVKREYQNFS
jgi:hypothetical protein